MINFMTSITIFTICLLFAALCLLLNSEDSSKEQKLMAYFTCGSIVQNAGYLFELVAVNKEAAMVATKIEYLGSMFVPICFCWFIFSYCFLNPPKFIFRIIEAVDATMLVVIWTCEYHSFYYRTIDWAPALDGHYCLHLEYGPGYMLFVAGSCLIPFALSYYALFRTLFSKRVRKTNHKYGLITFLTLLPLISLVSYSIGLTGGYDTTPNVMGLTLSLVSIFVWSRRNYDYGRMAARAVLENLGDGFITVDDQYRLVGYNQAACDIFSELNTHRLGDNIQSIQVLPEDILEEDTYKEFYINDRYYESHAQKITNHRGQDEGYVILILDVTETRNYIEEIKKFREEAEQANLAKSEFLANMSHEIRTPMNAIIGLSDIIMQESKGRKVYTYACDINAASQNLLAIINDILDLSKVEAGKMELNPREYYLKTMVDEVVTIMDVAAAKRGILMKCEYDYAIPCQYYGDDGRIKQILINLLNNAIKFTREGYVKISVLGSKGKDENEEMLTFKVEDTGCGIREEDLEKIFENFSQVDSKQNRSVEGTGLGLSISRQLIQLMNGSVDVDSVYGEGTTFTVRIPQRITDHRRLDETPQISEEKEAEVEAFTVTGYKVLVVDDNQVNRKVAMNFLKPFEFDLHGAESGFAAIDMVKETPFQIIFMDHMMPEMDGVETVHKIRTECGDNGKNAIIIALTANVMEGTKEYFLKNDFQDFLAKPIARTELARVLKKWIPDNLQQKKAPVVYGRSAEGVGNGESIKISEIDTKAAMELHGGNIANILELLRIYLAEGTHKKTLIKELFEKRDYVNYEVEVHALKSASAAIGALGISEEAKRHELAAGKKDEEYIAMNFSKLYTAYEELLDNIQDFLSNPSAVNQYETAQPVGHIEDGQLYSEIGEALERLENFRSKECAKIVDKLLKYQLSDDMRAGLKEVREQLMLYEDEKAEGLLRGLLEHRQGEA